MLQIEGSNPRAIATTLVEAMGPKFNGLFETPTIGGPGFINLKLCVPLHPFVRGQATLALTLDAMVRAKDPRVCERPAAAHAG